MVTIIKDGVIDISYGRYGNTSERLDEQQRVGFNPDIIRESEINSLVQMAKKYETPGFRARQAITNFSQKRVSSVNRIQGDSDLYRRSNLIDNNQANIVKDRITALYIKKDRLYNNIAPGFDLNPRGFYETNEGFIQNVGKLDRELIAPIRKIDTDNGGTRFLSSVLGYKNIERNEMVTPDVPILRNAAAIHTPISIISNGTKRTTRRNPQ